MYGESNFNITKQYIQDFVKINFDINQTMDQKSQPNTKKLKRKL